MRPRPEWIGAALATALLVWFCLPMPRHAQGDFTVTPELGVAPTPVPEVETGAGRLVVTPPVALPTDLLPARAVFWGVTIPLAAADARALAAVSGVGPVLANRLATASREGRASSWEAIDRIPGVGPTLLGRLQGAFILAGDQP